MSKKTSLIIFYLIVFSLMTYGQAFTIINPKTDSLSVSVKDSSLVFDYVTPFTGPISIKSTDFIRVKECQIFKANYEVIKFTISFHIDEDTYLIPVTGSNFKRFAIIKIINAKVKTVHFDGINIKRSDGTIITHSMVLEIDYIE